MARHTGPVTSLPDVPVRSVPVRLGQLLQLANLIESGAEAKEVIADGLVRVDGEVERRRGRQLRGGEVVQVEGAGSVRVVHAPE